MHPQKDEKFDVAVIGGGPSGLIAAGRAGELGARVIIIERNDILGKKLLMTGNGRCNLTQAEFDLRKLVEKFGENGKFLFSSLSVFGTKETIEFFNKLGLETKVERGGRVFPASDDSHDVLNTLIKYIERNNVKIRLNSKVTDIQKEEDKISYILIGEDKIFADRYIISTGGKSYPGTGSTGDGYKWATKLGHSITELSPSLVPVKISDDWVKELQGLSLKNVELNIYQNNKKQDSFFGEMLFTHFGISGPIVLSASKQIGQLLKKGEVKVSIDLKPALDFTKLDKRILRDFQEYQNKLFKNSLKDLLPQKLIPIIIKLSGIDPDKQVNSITREERHRVVSLLKKLDMNVSGLLGFDYSLVTSGGINIKEIDPKTMRSKLIKNLYFAGEIIDIDGPTGGYNLQMCWTTGYIAGQSSAIKEN